MSKKTKRGTVVIPAGRDPWWHELKAARILSLAGHNIEFLVESDDNKSPDILLDGIDFEIKSPKSGVANSIEHNLKKALKQSNNIIFSTIRMKDARDDNVRRYLIRQAKSRKQIKRLIMITKRGQIIDIKALV